MRVSERERAERLDAARDFIRKERRARRINFRQAAQMRLYLRSKSDEEVDGMFDDLVANMEEEDGYSLPRLGDGEGIDWPAFFSGLSGLIETLMPLIGMCI